MKTKTLLPWTALLLCTACILAGCGEDKAKKTPANTIQTYSVWCDSSSSLCWQNPQREAYNQNDRGLRFEEAELYCQELVLGGYDDWRLPTARELRTIIDGYTGTESGGSCIIGHTDSTSATYLEGYTVGDCGYAASLKGPGDGGCYTKTGITGTCNKTDPYSFGHQMEFFASDVPSDDSTGSPQVATVMFDNAAVVWNHRCTVGEVRCVRTSDGSGPAVSSVTADCDPGDIQSCQCRGTHQTDGYKRCSDDGKSWEPCVCASYTPLDSDQPECHNMVCDSADSVTLTIDVPDWESSWENPTQLMAFWYNADTWRFPESRQPDGGTWTNQRVDPGAPPYTMEVPACTYYQERYLEGEFKLMVILQREQKFPPIPAGEDFWWGWEQESTAFPLDGAASHSGSTQDMTVTLTRVDACPNICSPIPDDSATRSARWSSIYTTDNCIDFPASENWTSGEIETYVKGTPGYEQSNAITIETGNSCMVEMGGCTVAMRCYVEDASTGRGMYWYGAPDFICTGILNGTYESAVDNGEPFCTEYL